MNHRILFFCGHESAFGMGFLSPLLESSFEPAGVVLSSRSRWRRFQRKLSGSAPDPAWKARFHRLAHHLRSTRKVRSLARRHRVPVLITDDVNSPAFLDRLKTLEVDLFLGAAYPQIFRKELLAIPGMGSVNFHPSLLPKYRGAHPHFWSIVHGETESGITAHFMTENLDDGPIIAQSRFGIQALTYQQLYDRLLAEAASVVQAVQAFFEDGSRGPTPQREEDATMFRNDRDIHHRIFWSLHTAEDVHNLVRTEQAFCFFRDRKVTLLGSTPQPTSRNLTNHVRVESGTIVDIGNEALVIKVADSCLRIESVSCAGNVQRAGPWAKNVQALIGEKFH